MKRRGQASFHPIPWLPIDSRLIVPILSFSHVKGLARFFLILEIVLALLVVLGTFGIVLSPVVNPASTGFAVPTFTGGDRSYQIPDRR